MTIVSDSLVAEVRFRARPNGHAELERVKEWEVVQTLQTALYGRVYLHKQPQSGQMIVIKRMANSASVSALAGGSFMNAGVLESLVHPEEGENPSVEIGAYDYLTKVNPCHAPVCPFLLQTKGYWQDNTFTYLATPFCAGGGLFERVAASAGLPRDEVKRYMRQLLTAVRFMHAHNIAHRDISLENILIAEESGESIRLMDFGVACPITDTDGSPITYAEYHVGKVHYRAPEMHRRRISGLLRLPSYRADRVDVFACGMSMYCMFTGCNLWTAACTPDKIYHFIAQNGLRDLFRSRGFARFREVIDDDAMDVLAGLLEFDVERRLTVEEALRMPWFQN